MDSISGGYRQRAGLGDPGNGNSSKKAKRNKNRSQIAWKNSAIFSNNWKKKKFSKLMMKVKEEKKVKGQRGGDGKANDAGRTGEVRIGHSIYHQSKIKKPIAKRPLKKNPKGAKSGLKKKKKGKNQKKPFD